MNFVKLYIGDYLRDTGTLTLAQHGAYALMLLEHYATEKPLPEGRELHRLLRADSKAERDAIDFVAARYWASTECGLTNKRAAVEIERAANQRAINQEIGKRGGRPRRTEPRTEPRTESVNSSSAERREIDEKSEKKKDFRAVFDPTHAAQEAPRDMTQVVDSKRNMQTESVSESGSEPEANRNPIHSQTPEEIQIPKARRASARAPTPPDGMSEQVWSDWLALRKAKRAPVTATVIDGAEREATKAGMTLEAFLRIWCARGSQGMQAEWLKPAERGSHLDAKAAENGKWVKGTSLDRSANFDLEDFDAQRAIRA